MFSKKILSWVATVLYKDATKMDLKMDVNYEELCLHMIIISI